MSCDGGTLLNNEAIFLFISCMSLDTFFMSNASGDIDVNIIIMFYFLNIKMIYLRSKHKWVKMPNNKL